MGNTMKDFMMVMEASDQTIIAYHGSKSGHGKFVIGHKGGNTMGMFGNYDSVRYAAFFTDNKEFASQYGEVERYRLGPFGIRSIIDEDQAKRIAHNISEELFDEWREGDQRNNEIREMAQGLSQIAKGAWEFWLLFEDEIGKIFYEKATEEYGVECVSFYEDHVVEDEEGNDVSVNSESFAVLNLSKIKKEP